MLLLPQQVGLEVLRGLVHPHLVQQIQVDELAELEELDVPGLGLQLVDPALLDLVVP